MRPGIIALRLVQTVFVVPPLVGSVGAFADGDLGRGLGSLMEAAVLFVATEAALQILVGFVEGWEKPRRAIVNAPRMDCEWLRDRIHDENDRSLQEFVRSVREEAAGRPTIRM
jgi:hypothetical protein